jgi:hypothetical protein
MSSSSDGSANYLSHGLGNSLRLARSRPPFLNEAGIRYIRPDGGETDLPERNSPAERPGSATGALLARKPSPVLSCPRLSASLELYQSIVVSEGHIRAAPPPCQALAFWTIMFRGPPLAVHGRKRLGKLLDLVRPRILFPVRPVSPSSIVRCRDRIAGEPPKACHFQCRCPCRDRRRLFSGTLCEDAVQ